MTTLIFEFILRLMLPHSSVLGNPNKKERFMHDDDWSLLHSFATPFNAQFNNPYFGRQRSHGNWKEKCHAKALATDKRRAQKKTAKKAKQRNRK
jgi:hypothetical protein